MNITDLIRGEKFDALPRSLEALGQVFPGFLLGVGLQFDDVETLLVGAERVQRRDQR